MTHQRLAEIYRAERIVRGRHPDYVVRKEAWNIRMTMTAQERVVAQDMWEARDTEFIGWVDMVRMDTFIWKSTLRKSHHMALGYAKNLSLDAQFKTPAMKAQEAQEANEQAYIRDIQARANDDYWFERLVIRTEKMISRERPYRDFDHYLHFTEMSETRYRVNGWTMSPVDDPVYWGQLFHYEREQMNKDYEAHKIRRIQEWGWEEENPFEDEINIAAFDIKELREALVTLKKTAHERIDIDAPESHKKSYFVTLATGLHGVMLFNDNEEAPSELVDYDSWVSPDHILINTVRFSMCWLTNTSYYKGVLDLEKTGRIFLSVNLAQDEIIGRIGNTTFRFPYGRIQLHPAD